MRGTPIPVRERVPPNPSGLCQCGCGGKAPIAKAHHAAHGHIKGLPIRYIPGHQSLRSLDEYLIDPKTDCWVWQRFVNDQGYGIAVREGRRVRAHRWYWERANGPIPAGLGLDHLCHNEDPSCEGGVCIHRRCVNPAHLEPAPQAQNARRGKGTKLDREQVFQIRELAAEGWTQKDIAPAYGIARGYVSQLVNEATWRAA
jgi:hypothetical protein